MSDGAWMAVAGFGTLAVGLTLLAALVAVGVVTGVKL